MAKATIKLDDWLEYLKSRVGIDVYVWGGNGELIVNQMPHLAKMEKADHSYEDAITNTDRVLTLLNKRLLQGVDIFKIRGEDCSGLGVKYLLDKGIIKSDMTCNSLYDLTKAHKVAIKDVRAGDFVFCGSEKKKWHIGYVISKDYVIESKNHDVGVVQSKISETQASTKPWDYATRPSWYSDEPKEKPVLKRELYITEPLMRGDDVRDCQRLLVDKGYNPGVNDGIYGKKTMEAVKDFQIDENLGIKRLGTVGKKTATALGFIWEG